MWTIGHSQAKMTTAEQFFTMGVAFFAFVAGVYRYVLKPAFRTAVVADQIFPVLKEIAEQVKNDHGSSLKDTLDCLVTETSLLKDEIKTLNQRFMETPREKI